MLVAPEYVLTAAHCGSDYDAYRIGALCKESTNACTDSTAAEYIAVDRFIPHPNYDDFTSDNDYSLVKLARSATATPVQMDQGSVVSGYSGGEKVWAIGFGNTDTTNAYYPNRLQHVEVSFVTQSSCRNSYGFSAVTNNMMCASDENPNQDSCQGDSGGPLYDKTNNALVGVTSWGRGCAETGFPGVYAKVAAKWDWIRTTICADSTNKPDFCGPSAPTPAPTPSQPGNCVDSPSDWFDSDGSGFNCEWYGQDSNP